MDKDNGLTQRNGIIELLRFVFAVTVVMVHTHGLRPESANYPFCGGYIAVEFFLILSGYYTALRFAKTPNREPIYIYISSI